ncbi:hypothetical protein PMZ80_010609 [Knufia obscura]|uniref:MAGE domain-containing protein n=1 Tax=Knufia obscura TaxID=1635080 RepID=A0ABR0RA51_9EURO|nr:hypothetical protein PMZ80_010609 [Knufia obscura]
MPRTLKRRADAISRDQESDAESPSDSPPRRRSTQQQPQSTRRRQRRRSTPPSDVSRSDNDASDNDADADPAADTQSQSKTMIKKLVRLALSSEYARQPLRRTDITAKILKSDTGSTSTRVNFRSIFLGAQIILRDVFGMELVDLPSRERVGLNERRKAASQKATQKEAATQRRARDEDEGGGVETQTQGRRKDPVLSAQSWILVSTLPTAYKTRPELLVPSRAPDQGVESAYVALYTIIVSLLYLHTPSGGGGDSAKQVSQGKESEDATEPISDAKLHRYLSRLSLSEWTPMGVEGANVEKLLARMMREGYVERRRDNSGGEEVVEWVVGPRGKREVGRMGVAGLVRGVYGFGVDGEGRGLEVPVVDGEDGDEEGEPQRRRPVKMEKDELERRLKRTLGGVVGLKIGNGGQGGVVEAEGEPEPEQEQEEEREERAEGSRRRNRNANEGRAPRRSGRRRGGDEDDEDDE